MEKYLVVGAGISGLSAAVFLAQAGKSVELWEQKTESGGLLAPIRFQGVPCDRGSHRVHPESHPLLRELTDAENWLRQPRNGMLLLGGRQVPYPPSPISFLRGIGIYAAAHMGVGFLTRPARRRSFRNWEEQRGQVSSLDIGFEEFVIARVGRPAYERFYRPYVEKVWGIDPRNISQSVAKQRVSTANPLQTFRRALRGSKNQDQSFLYPKNGLAAMLAALREKACSLGVTIKEGAAFNRTEDHSQYNRIFYSGHLGDLVPDSQLSHRGLYIIHLAFPKGYVADNDTWYAPEKRFWFGRVSQPEKFSPVLKFANHDILCVEIPEGRWGAEHNFLEAVTELTEQLHQAGIIQAPVSASFKEQTWLPRVYPMYQKGWFKEWQKTMDQLCKKQLIPVGRQGLFLHCNMDHCVHISWEAVQHHLNGKSPAEWGQRCSEFLDLRVRD